MTHQTIIELSNPIDGIAREIGYCMAMFMLLPSALSNPQFIVRQYYTGFIRVVDAVDFIAYGNPAIDGLIPPIPKEWTKNK